MTRHWPTQNRPMQLSTSKSLAFAWALLVHARLLQHHVLVKINMHETVCTTWSQWPLVSFAMWPSILARRASTIWKPYFTFDPALGTAAEKANTGNTKSVRGSCFRHGVRILTFMGKGPQLGQACCQGTPEPLGAASCSNALSFNPHAHSSI